MPEQQTTHQKALALNLDSSKYGVIAEIGAGQEVARWFFRVGGAAGTVAKTVSAYDMTVSDGIYGKSKRYVSRDRLDAMLEFEYDRVVDRLAGERGGETTFFAFADTVSSRNYKGTNVCHGWMGVRFQSEKGGAASTARLHIGMLDSTNELQQQAVGILGVNLIHAAFCQRASCEEFLGSLLDGLSLERIEVDHLDLAGPAFEGFPDDLGLPLIRSELARVVSWSDGVATLDLMSAIYGRPVVIERGWVPGATSSEDALMRAGLDHLTQEAEGARRAPVGLYEVALTNQTSRELLSDQEAEQRIAELRALGRPVLLSNISETFNFTNHLKRLTKEPIRFAVGLSRVVHVFHEAYYTTLDGGVLEAFAQLLGADVKLYVLPEAVESLRETVVGLEGGAEMWSLPESGLATLENTEPTTRLRHLYRYMREIGSLVTVDAS